ncbi:MAG: cyclic nucleotide-binding domain-containing protein [Ardenticatenaceae bacterium]|nr:cyclic nucleotide-binding domain-containing protein [Ardenticatenaceae bacterium]MCB8988824.1 cyclic nucleotide-binding domain-containing protein [Ardenticatenaceae bacterium]
MVEEGEGERFWTAVSAAVDPGTYKPQRSPCVQVVRLESQGEPYYVLKQPESKTYLRLTEPDYALWWQMDGRKSLKDLLFYNLVRYKSLPIAHLNRLVADLRAGHFFQDRPVNVYDQINAELAARAPENRGRRLLRGFLHTEIARDGWDGAFTMLYRWLGWLFTWPAQFVLLVIILLGGVLYGRLFFDGRFPLLNGGLSLLTLLAANFIVIFIHELAHGLTVKHVGRELNRGGFLIYWGMPAFFVDTRDTWLSTRLERIAVSWAGPHSGLIIGGLIGLGLTYALTAVPAAAATLWAAFLFQMGFIAYLTVFFNLNPLLELDGYFILMDWLDMPGLRQRAFRFWREQMWPRRRELVQPRTFWQALSRHERLFVFFGALAFAYSVYALWFALYFWQTRLLPLGERLWTDYGWWGRALLLGVITAVVIPTAVALLRYGWSRLHAALEWLARRDLLARSDVLALLLGLPLLLGVPLLAFALTLLPYADLAISVLLWLLHLAVLAALVGIARQLTGSRFQWGVWSLTIAFVGITLALISPHSPLGVLWRDAALVLAAAGILAAGIVAWFTIQPDALTLRERLAMAAFFLLGLAYLVGVLLVGGDGRFLTTLLIIGGIFPGLMFMTPLLSNFWRSRFGVPWVLLVLAILIIPWLQFLPALHLPEAVLWLYAALLYLLLGALARFGRAEVTVAEVAAFSERERLVSAFNHFMQALFASYEAVFGSRRLRRIYSEILTLGPIDPDDTILTLADRCRAALLLAVDRLDDLAGTPFTRRAGQAAYDSLPWPEAETLGRQVLAEMAWGSGLAAGFIQARDRRRELIRNADIFAGLDDAGLDAVLAVIRPFQCRAGHLIAQGGSDAASFYLVEEGRVAEYNAGIHTASIEAGGYFGTAALLAEGTYRATFRAETAVRALVIDRQHFDPLLRADTTLASQVSSGAQSRRLLKQMPLFSSLSPQQLAVIDARLQPRSAAAGEVIVRQGQVRSYLFIVAAGQLEVLTGDGEEDQQVVGRLGPGEHFGEYALFADQPYAATLRAAAASELYLLDEPTFDRLAAEYERMSHYVEQIGSGRLLAATRKMGVTAVLS